MIVGPYPPTWQDSECPPTPQYYPDLSYRGFPLQPDRPPKSDQ